MVAIKENTLWYNEKEDSHYYVLFNSNFGRDVNGNLTNDEYVMTIWLGNGELQPLPVGELGILVEEFEEFSDAEDTIMELIDFT